VRTLGGAEASRPLTPSARRGSGKSLVLAQALQDLADTMRREAVSSASSSLQSLGHGLPFVVVHLNGFTIPDDQTAVREISKQLSIDAETATAAAVAEVGEEPHVRAPKRPRSGKARHTAHSQSRHHAEYSFEQHLAYVVQVLRDGRLTGMPVVMVIDEFDLFCQRTKQSLLYNLLDLTQDAT
jgi:Cdc6-like AAA superfamily ATPase